MNVHDASFLLILIVKKDFSNLDLIYQKNIKYRNMELEHVVHVIKH